MPSIEIARQNTLEHADGNIGNYTDAANSGGSLHAKVAAVKNAVDVVDAVVDANATKLGVNTAGAGTTTVFARLKQIYDHLATYLSATISARIDTTISSRQSNWGAVTATKTNIDTTKTNTDTIKTNVGSNSDASSATGSAHAKLKDIKSTVALGSVKSVQRGVATVPFGGADIVINAVNMSKTITLEAFIVNANNGQFYSNAGCSLKTSNTIRLSHPTSDLAYVTWQLVEYY